MARHWIAEYQNALLMRNGQMNLR